LIKTSAVFGSVALSVFATVAEPLPAHPGVGIVMDARGNVYYTDLARVWKIAPDGRKTVAVPNVHTHELCLDSGSNLYGEHVWYEGGATDRWGYRVWRRAPDGTMTDVVPARRGFRTDYGFVRDAAGNMYSAAPVDPSAASGPTSFRRRAPDGKVTTIVQCSDCRNVRWMTASGDGTLYFTDSGDLRELSADGQIRTIARNLAVGAGSVPQGQEWRLVMGLWTDAARNVYVAVYGLREVKRVSPEGRVEVVAKSRFPWAPTGGLIAPDGDLWLLESTFANAVRVRRIENFGETECLRVLEQATSPVEAAVRAFEAGEPTTTAARAVLARARAARDVLEQTAVAESCTPSKNEELIYLNHLLMGFDGWLDAQARRPPVPYDLESIVRRARTHRERGRARLR
jgi:sugar lactone lactonase YvrE